MFCIRSMLLAPPLVALLLTGVSVSHPLLVSAGLLLLWTVLTLAAARFRLAPVARLTLLSALDATMLLAATMGAGANHAVLQVALPTWTLLAVLQTLSWGRRGALPIALLCLAGGALPPLWHGVRAPEIWSAVGAWAFQNTLLVALLAAYAERQEQRFSQAEARERALIGEVAHQSERAMRDSLTGLYNRRFLEQRLREEIARARRTNRPLALALLDVDYLKRWNDTHGHAAGDAALRTVAELLARACRGADVVCRLGGEEFVLLAPDTDADGLFALVDRIRAAAAETELVGDDRPHPRTLSFSAGVIRCDVFREPDDLLQAADAALYAAKEAGRNRVVLGHCPPRNETQICGVAQ